MKAHDAPMQTRIAIASARRTITNLFQMQKKQKEKNERVDPSAQDEGKDSDSILRLKRRCGS